MMLGFRSFIQKSLDKARWQKIVIAAGREKRPTEFRLYPNPTHPGDYHRGLRLLSGEYLHQNELIKAESNDIWEMYVGSQHFFEYLHSMDWINDLAAVHTQKSRELTQAWFISWLKHYKSAENTRVWAPELVAWRLIRMLTHVLFLSDGWDMIDQERFYESVAFHNAILRLSLDTVDSNHTRIIVLSARVFAALSLNDGRDDLEQIVKQLDDECVTLVANQSVNLPSRNLEQMANIFCLLVWVDEILDKTDTSPRDSHDLAIDLLGKSLRTLRPDNQRLLDNHGGGIGHLIAIERALSVSQVQGLNAQQPLMGYHHVRLGSLTAMMDCAPPPYEANMRNGHASVLGFWVYERQNRLIGSAGSALNRGLITRTRAQEASSHSTLLLDGISSSTFIPPDPADPLSQGGACFDDAARTGDSLYLADDTRVIMGGMHYGFERSFGILHDRKIAFDRDGRFFAGVDTIKATHKGMSKLKSHLAGAYRNGIAIDIFFHLGPRIKPILDPSAQRASFTSPSGALWVFSQVGGIIEIDENHFYDPERIAEIPCYVLHIRSRLVDTSGVISWSFQVYE